jgi:TatD DNase family protein
LEEHAVLLGAVGVHAHDAQAADDAYLDWLRELAGHPKIAVWGEIGLDYYYDHSPRERQQDLFRTQLRIARSLRKPVTIHCRDAWDDLAAILNEEWAGDHPGGILHSYTGTAQDAAAFASAGFLISFSGMITFKNAALIREAARGLRPDQVLVETDSPYLAPVPHRGRRNEPAFVLDVARGLADAMGLGLEELARATSDNFARLLGPGPSLPG